MLISDATIVSVATALALSTFLVAVLLARRHLHDFSSRNTQTLLLHVVYWAPIYSIGSFLNLAVPSASVYITFLIDCYQGYALYAFFLLAMSFLGCDDDDFSLVAYLETKPTFSLGFPLNFLCSKDVPRGRAFLLYCRSGIIQFCILKPGITAVSFVLNEIGVYNEFSTSATSGYIYLIVIINISVIYAFAALAAFYTVFKMKLKPFQSDRKFLWINCLIFFTFWQSVILTGIVQAGVVSDLGGHSKPLAPTRIQDLLICFEMLLAIIFCLYIFSHEPYTSGYVNPYDYSDYEEDSSGSSSSVYERSGRPGALGSNYRYSMLNKSDSDDTARIKSNRSKSSTRSVPSGKSRLVVTDPTKLPTGSHTSADIESGGAGSDGVSDEKPKTVRKYRASRGPSDLLRRLSQGKAEYKGESLLPSDYYGPTAATAVINSSSSNRSRNKEIAMSPVRFNTTAATAGSFVIEGEDDEEVEEEGMGAVESRSLDRLSLQSASYHDSSAALPEDVMKLLGATVTTAAGGSSSSSGGGSGSQSRAVRDMDEFGHDGDTDSGTGTVLLRSIQNKYANTEYEVNVDSSSLAVNTNRLSLETIGGESNSSLNPMLLPPYKGGMEEEAVSSWSSKSMKERSASVEQRLVAEGHSTSTGSTAKGTGGGGGVNVIKKTTTITKKTKKHHKHHEENSTSDVTGSSL